MILLLYYRALQSIRPELRNPQKNILDGDLLWKYLHLSMMEKTEIAKRIGTSLEQVYKCTIIDCQ